MQKKKIFILNKWLLFLTIILLIFTVIICFKILAFTLHFSSKTKKMDLSALQINSSIDLINNSVISKKIKRGKYLARIADCIACHTVRGSTPYSGNYAIQSPFGTIFTPNLTPDNKTGLGKWTSEDFYHAMHDGISKDGKFLYPAFPYPSYTKMSREDTDSIYLYLCTLKPIFNQKHENLMLFPFNIRYLLIGWNFLFFHKGEYQFNKKQSVEYNRGAYLVEGPGHCGMCHTPMNLLGGSNNSNANLSGNLIPVQNWFAPALNSNKYYGLGKWSIKEIVEFLRTGKTNKSVVFGPMSDVVYNSTQYLTESDAHAISIYLKMQPDVKFTKPVTFKVSKTFARELKEEGRKLYTTNCIICHGSTGKGIPPHFPPLTQNSAISMEPEINLIKIILNGGYPPVTRGNLHPYGMPPFAHLMNDREVAAVASYVNMNWNNKGKAISPQQVSSLRSTPIN